MNKIGISGAFSVGKSTVVKNLELSGYNKIDEVAREFFDKSSIRPEELDLESLTDVQLKIIKMQSQAEDSHKKFVTDATIHDILAYSRGADFARVQREMSKEINSRVYDIIFYIPPELEIENDGLRHTDTEFQKVIDERIQENLINSGSRIVTITGSVEERLNTIYKTLNGN